MEIQRINKVWNPKNKVGNSKIIVGNLKNKVWNSKNKVGNSKNSLWISKNKVGNSKTRVWNSKNKVWNSNYFKGKSRKYEKQKSKWHLYASVKKLNKKE